MNEVPEDSQGRAARAAVFTLLWFIASFYFFGDLGKWTDDWMFHVRDPVTGGFRWRDLFALDPLNAGFWRPFHIHSAIALQTLLWSHDWAIHLILALLHGLNAWLLWSVLRRMCASPQAPAVGTLLFLVYPAGHEAIFWVSTIGTTVGVSWFLLCTLGAQRFGAGRIGSRGLLLHLPLLFTLAWWYEQPAAAAPAIALAYLACAPATIPMSKRLLASAGIAAAAFLAGMLYAGLLMATISPLARGGAQTVIKPDEFVPQLELILTQAWRIISLSNFASGAMKEGWWAVRSRPIEAVVVAVYLLVAVYAFGRWWMRGSDALAPGAPALEPARAPAPFQRLCALGFGVCIVAASMVPAVAVHNQWFASRLAYLPTLGLLVVLAIAIDIPFSAPWAQSRCAPGRAWRGAWLGALVPALGCGAIMLVGVQSVWHKRAALDVRVADSLRALVPNPPAQTVFIPVRIHGWPTNTGSWGFDNIGLSPFEAPWCLPLALRFIYHRSDLHALGINRWLPPGRCISGCEGATASGVVLAPGTLGQAGVPIDASGRTMIPWSSVVAFQIEKDGRVRLVTSARVEDSDNPARDLLVHLSARGGPTAGEGPPRPAMFAAWPIAGPTPDRPAWRLAGPLGNEPAERATAGPATALGDTYAAFTMHPNVSAIPDRSELRAPIAPMDHAQTLAMRVALSNQTLALSDGVGVSIRLEGVAEPLVREAITPERLRRERCWIVVRAVLPPAGAPRVVRVIVDAGSANDPNSDWCLITPPVLTPTTPDERIPHAVADPPLQ